MSIDIDPDLITPTERTLGQNVNGEISKDSPTEQVQNDNQKRKFSRICHFAGDPSGHHASLKEPAPLMILIFPKERTFFYRYVCHLLGAPPEGRATKN